LSLEYCHAFMADLEARDLDRLKSWFTPESILWIPPSDAIQGQQRIVVMFRLIFRMYTEIHWKVTEIYAVSPSRYIFLTDSWGVIGKQTPYKNNVVTIIEFTSSGKIQFLSDYFKNTAIFTTEKPLPVTL